MNLGLDGKVVLITGASGGIGAAAAKAFSEEGAKVVIHYGRNEKAAADLRKKMFAESIIVSADMSSEESVNALFAQAVEKLGRVDIVVSNAGIFPSADLPIDEMPASRFDEVIATNLRGTWLTAREFFRHLRQTKPSAASLVFVSSTAAVFGEAGHSEYAASKAAIIGLMKSLKNEMTRIVPKGRVNAVAPGWTWTPMTEEFKSDDAAVKKSLQTRALRRIGRPEEVARQILLLTSDEVSGYVTGQCVEVSGGMEGRVLWEKDEIDPSQA